MLILYHKQLIEKIQQLNFSKTILNIHSNIEKQRAVKRYFLILGIEK